MFSAGLDPFAGKEAHVARHLRDLKVQPLRTGRRERMTFSGWDALIPSSAAEALEPRTGRQPARGHVLEIPNPGRPAGYRPGRKLTGRQPRKGVKRTNQGRRTEPRE